MPCVNFASLHPKKASFFCGRKQVFIVWCSATLGVGLLLVGTISPYETLALCVIGGTFPSQAQTELPPKPSTAWAYRVSLAGTLPCILWSEGNTPSTPAGRRRIPLRSTLEGRKARSLSRLPAGVNSNPLPNAICGNAGYWFFFVLVVLAANRSPDFFVANVLGNAG